MYIIMMYCAIPILSTTYVYCMCMEPLFSTGEYNNISTFSSPLVQFLDFVRVNFVMQLSRNLPTQLVGFDARWPHAPQPLQETSDILKEMYRLYLARKFMRKLSPDDREQVCMDMWERGEGRRERENEREREREREIERIKIE